MAEEQEGANLLAAISILTVIASQNTFHKVINYQTKGKPI